MVKRIFVLFCFSLLSFSSLAANITVQLDRDPVTIDESFRIIFEADDKISIDPDFRPLQQDFEILSRSQVSSMKYANGNYRKKTRWNLLVMAKRSGTITVPSISIGNDVSPSITITVNESSRQNDVNKSAELFIEAEATPNTAYVQQQIIYSVRFFRAVSINAASMAEPNINDADVVIEKLGDDSSYETYRNGRRYVVIERKYALFPQRSGSITIEPITLDAQLTVTAASAFDPFAQSGATKRLKSNSITLDVKPVPDNIHSNAWLPASDLKITEGWSQQPPVFRVGEPITRTLTLKAEGLTAAQLPSLAMADTQDFKTYPDQPRLNDKRGSRGISGTRQEKIALIPTRAGQLTLPAIEIKWWNINSNTLETITLPARSVEVQPGANNQTNKPATDISQAAPAQPVPEAATPVTETITVVKHDPGIYAKLSLFLGLGWLITALAWFISRRHHKAVNGTRPMAKQRPTASLKAVKQACQDNNPQQCKTTLLSWAEDHWPESPPANLSEIGKRLDQATQQEVERLNQALYGSASESWQGSGLWQKLSVAAKISPEKPDKQQDVLLPLYP
ncbi:MAG TPA: protein BatD [Candidatus Tenderia electrophaga]|uniref:Protein BatD n=1 Tax=Candidatus Tenderia electrophaga TaxID=1748243 RepID=A0A832J487_9GAMM|nr:protein BatD [Candidatus Tenderia electrophaga]